jgi:hypothetical protein
MLQYIFFHQRPFELFVDFIRGKGLGMETRVDEAGYEVSIAEDIEDELADNIDAEYDRLLDMNRELMGIDDNSDTNYAMASVNVHLKDGLISEAFIEPDLMNRIMQVLTPQEFGRVVQSISRAVENPDDRSYCQRVRDGDEV